MATQARSGALDDLDALKFRGRAPPRIRVSAQQAGGEVDDRGGTARDQDQACSGGSSSSSSGCIRARNTRALASGSPRSRRRFVERHGGTISVESSLVVGTTFTCQPARSDPEPIMSAHPIEDPPRRGQPRRRALDAGRRSARARCRTTSRISRDGEEGAPAFCAASCWTRALCCRISILLDLKPRSGRTGARCCQEIKVRPGAQVIPDDRADDVERAGRHPQVLPEIHAELLHHEALSISSSSITSIESIDDFPGYRSFDAGRARALDSRHRSSRTIAPMRGSSRSTCATRASLAARADPGRDPTRRCRRRAARRDPARPLVARRARARHVTRMLAAARAVDRRADRDAR